MKIKTLISIFFLLQAMYLYGQSRYLWTVGTAKNLSRSQYEFAAFQLSRYGWKADKELQVQPYGFLIAPNFYLKKQWYNSRNSDLCIASRHGFMIPTFLLNVASGVVDEQIIASDAKFPFKVVLRNEILVSKLLEKGTTCTPPNYLLTIKLGVKKSFGSSDSVPFIHHPFFYQDYKMLTGDLLVYAGIDLEAHYGELFNYSIDFDIIRAANLAFAHKALIVYSYSPKISICGGYQLAYDSQNPTKKISFFPLLDVLYRFSFTKPKEHKKLFEDGVLPQ